MEVIKRDGTREPVKFDKISARIKKQTYGLSEPFVDYIEVSKKVISGLYDGVTVAELDSLAAETAASMITVHPDYSVLASRIALTSLYKTVDKEFSKVAERLYDYINPKTGERAGMISDEVMDIIKKNAGKLDAMIVSDRDFNFDYFGFKTLEKGYLLKANKVIAETPQHMYMRVSVGIWKDNLEMVQKTYDMMSQGLFTHATPTLFNSGTKRPQMSSCFLVDVDDDSIPGIYKTLSDCAVISQNAGGIGINIHKIRSKGSYIKGTNGTSNGIVPMLKVFNETARYVDQGGGKRKGSIAVYIEPWHGDILDFLDLRKNHGKEEMRTRDLFLALWIPDLFMERVEQNGDWSLFSPNEAPELIDAYDSDTDKKFTALYEKYESEGRAVKTMKARDLWEKILVSQIETGTPYMLYKDAANTKSNQKNLGTIKSSNLCTEIIEYSSKDETAVCNLASIALPKMIEIPSGKVREKNKKLRTFNFELLYQVAYQATINLNQVIDVNFYPTPETFNSNMRHRPIGLGVQGLADTFALMSLPFESEEAIKLNKDIFETIYFAACTASKDLAKKFEPYSSFQGSPASEGILQFDMWNVKEEELSGMWDWKKLKADIKKYGMRNSLLLAPMPTASTSQILGNNECFEPFTTNLYKRNTLSGEYVVINKHLIEDLININLWNDKIRLKLFAENGSVQNITEIPADIREVYKTVWEMKGKTLLEMAKDRAVFIDQSQSLNLFMAEPNQSKLSSAHFYGWKLRLKTGMYYLRSKAKASALKGLGVDMSQLNSLPDNATPVEEVKPKEHPMAPNMNDTVPEQFLGNICSLDNPDCETCSA
jgi:ribonucleoside-diphosphate reductase alpha chain